MIVNNFRRKMLFYFTYFTVVLLFRCCGNVVVCQRLKAYNFLKIIEEVNAIIIIIVIVIYLTLFPFDLTMTFVSLNLFL